MAKSHLEVKFANLWRMMGGPDILIQEYRFHPERAWRFDFAHPPSMTAVEVEGGVYSNGRHVRGKGFEEDCLKYSEAALMGWAVVRLTADQIQPDIVERLIARCMTKS